MPRYIIACPECGSYKLVHEEDSEWFTCKSCGLEFSLQDADIDQV